MDIVSRHDQDSNYEPKGVKNPAPNQNHSKDRIVLADEHNLRVEEAYESVGLTTDICKEILKSYPAYVLMTEEEQEKEIKQLKRRISNRFSHRRKAKTKDKVSDL